MDFRRERQRVEVEHCHWIVNYPQNTSRCGKCPMGVTVFGEWKELRAAAAAGTFCLGPSGI